MVVLTWFGFVAGVQGRWNHRGKGAISQPHQIMAKLEAKTVPSISFVQGILGECNYVSRGRAILLQK